MSDAVLSVGRIYFPVRTLGYGNRLGLWVRGCPRHCLGCASPELHEASKSYIPVRKLIMDIPSMNGCDGLTISGGEPFDQVQGVLCFAHWFLQTYNDDIMIYTGYTMEELHARNDPYTEELINLSAAIADGPYNKEQDHGKGLCGSENQRLYVQRYPERYSGFLTVPRKLQASLSNGKILMIGLPSVSTPEGRT